MLSEEQVQFARALERFGQQAYAGTPAENRFDEARLSRAAEMGCLALGVPEEQGGFGGQVEVMLMMQTLAAALPQEPIFSSGVHGAALLSAAMPSDTAAEMLEAMTDGSLVAVPALAEEGSRYGPDQVATLARADGDGWILSGKKSLVLHAAQAHALIASVRLEEDGTLALFRIDAETPGLRLEDRRRIDALPCADVHFDSCKLPGSALIARSGVSAMIETANDHAEAAQVAEMVGLMDALIEGTIAYLKTRKQFGSEIGRFQALQHRVADMWILCEETRSLALAAAMACENADADRSRVVSMAKLHACDAAHKVAAEAVQMHGGIGVTDELIIGHWFKRLSALRSSLGDRRFHLNRLVGTVAC